MTVFRDSSVESGLFDLVFQARAEHVEAVGCVARLQFSVKESVYARVRAFAASCGVVVTVLSFRVSRSGLFGLGGDRVVSGVFDFAGDEGDVERVKAFVVSVSGEDPVNLWGF